jgi:hypothetical protein
MKHQFGRLLVSTSPPTSKCEMIDHRFAQDRCELFRQPKAPLQLRPHNQPPDICQIGHALRCDQPVFCQMRTQSVDRLRSLPDEKISRPENHSTRLLLRRLWFNKSHSRPAGCFGYGFCISGIILLALYERLNVRRWHQPHIVSQSTYFTGPVMCCSTGLHRHYTGRQVREKCQHLAPRQLFANSNAAISRGAVNLENPLCQI